MTPSAIESEAQLVGGILVHPRILPEVIAEVTPPEFCHPALRVIFEAIVALDSDSQPIDAVSVANRMRGDGTFDRLNAAGGDEYLTDLMCKVVTVENHAYHARIVRSKARRRRYAELTDELRVLAYDADTGDDEFFSQVDAALLDLQRGDVVKQQARHVNPLLNESIRDIERRYENRHNPAALGITTAFSELDRTTTGLHPGELWIIAARPSMGKSAFAGNMAVAQSARGFPGLVFSLEMSNLSLVERMLACEGRVDAQSMRSGHLTGDDWKAISRTGDVLARRPLWVDDEGTLDIIGIRSRARRWRLTEGASGSPCVVIVDYLQLVSAQSRRGELDREREIAAVSRGLKALAKEINGAVVALAQLNRKCEERSNKRPILSDLRDSGQIEQDADVIAFLYRDEVYEPKTQDKGICEVIIAKQRNGPIGTTRLGWQPRFGRFVDLSATEQEQSWQR